MNQKTAKLIRKYAVHASGLHGWKSHYRDMKKGWKEIPRQSRQEVRRQMAQFVS